jgi:hypothetical protein
VEKNVKRKHNFIRCTYGGMEDTPVAKRFDKLCNIFFPVAELGAMLEDSCNSLIEQIHALKNLVTQVLKLIMKNMVYRKVHLLMGRQQIKPY